jgi:hypothetical protein
MHFYKGFSMAFFAHRVGGGAHVVAGYGGVQMVMLVRSKKEYFTDFITREAKEKNLKLVINGSFSDLGLLNQIWTYSAGNSALDASLVTPVGQVIQKGKVLAGKSEVQKFQLSQGECDDETFSVGKGNPNANACAAIGGVAPILVGGFPHGVGNLYKPGVPAGAPLENEVAPKFMPFLVQKNNAMYKYFQSQGPYLGKTAIGYSSSTKTTLIIVQHDGDPGLTADEFRSVYQSNDVDNAVFLDGSTSSTLYYDGNFLVRPSQNKNEYLTVAIGFK